MAITQFVGMTFNLVGDGVSTSFDINLRDNIPISTLNELPPGSPTSILSFQLTDVDGVTSLPVSVTLSSNGHTLNVSVPTPLVVPGINLQRYGLGVTFTYPLN